MLSTLLFPTVPHLRVDAAVRQDDQIVILARLTERAARCPRCRRRSRRVQSHYDRRLTDLPCGGSPVTIQLRVRRFVCWLRRCPQRIFSERVPALVLPHARRTVRAQVRVLGYGFALGGAPGARQARRDGLPVSRRTLLRAVRAVPFPPTGVVRVLSVDDFAFRKGRTYGTVLVDLEARQVVDLLPDRTAATFAAWLHAHPGVEVISRDRASAYADGARQGAPTAVQVADRFHLLKNLSDAVERYLCRKHTMLRMAAQQVHEASSCATAEEPTAPPVSPRPVTHAAQDSQARRSRRYARYQEVCALHQAGVGLREIAHRLGLGRATVRRFVRAEGFPEQAPRPRRTALSPFAGYLHQRWMAGCHNAQQLFAEVRAQGYPGTVSRVRQFVAQWRDHPGRRGRPPRQQTRGPVPRRSPSTPAKSPRQATWLLLRSGEQLHEEEHAYLLALQHVCPEVIQVQALAQGFGTLLGNHDLPGLDPWIAAVAHSNVAELIGFATGLQRDRAAVDAAFTAAWSQGQTEGQVNRIKTTKRSMYGRATFDLLRQRVLHGA